MIYLLNNFTHDLWNQILFCIYTQLQVAAEGFTGHQHNTGHMPPGTDSKMSIRVIIEFIMLAVPICFKNCITLMLDVRLPRNGKHVPQQTSKVVQKLDFGASE